MTTTERIRASIAKNPTHTDHQIAKNVGVWVAEVVAARESRMVPAPAPIKPKAGIAGKTLDAFRTQHDVAYIIDAHIKTHLHDKADAYFTDHEFREICGIPASNWRRFADDTRFAEYRLIRGQHNLWASRKMISEMRRILGI